MYTYIDWRCLWCNGYHCGKWTQQTVCISHGINTLGKGMNPTILPPVKGNL